MCSQASAHPKPKRLKTTCARNTHDEEESTELNHVEHFVIQAGHKFLYNLWPVAPFGALLFRVDWMRILTSLSVLKMKRSKCQAQLREIWELLQAKFELEDLKQTWVAKAGMSFVLRLFFIQ